MARQDYCDVCGKALTEENPKAAKLYLSPAVGGKIWRHNEYTAHLDVGNCCLTKVKQFGKWQRRKKRKAPKISVETAVPGRARVR